MDETFFQEWAQELRAFHQDTITRLAAQETWQQRHEAQMQAMQAQHEDQMTGIRQIMSHIATHMIDHETRLSDQTRTLQEISATLQAIRDSL